MLNTGRVIRHSCPCTVWQENVMPLKHFMLWGRIEYLYIQNANVTMNTGNVNVNLIESYLELLKNLSPDNKLELIARLSQSMKTRKSAKSGSLASLYGAFISEQSADELIADLKKARTFNRQRPEL